MPQPVTGTISGSRAATVLGLNEWSSQVEVWQKIMEERQPGFNESNGLVLPEFESNAPIRWGTAFESAVIACAQDETGDKVKSREKIFKKEYGGVPMSCHVDGIIDGDDGNILFEGKTTSSWTFRQKWTDSVIPRNYYLQVQHNMYVADLESALVAVLVFPEQVSYYEKLGWEIWDKHMNHPDKKSRSLLSFARFLHDFGCLHIYRIPRNRAFFNTILLGYRSFWDQYVLTSEAPTPVNVKDINRLCPEPKVEILIDTPKALAMFDEYSYTKGQLGKKGELSVRADELKVAILNMARNAGVDDNSGTVGFTFKGPNGQTLGSYKKSERGSWTFRA